MISEVRLVADGRVALAAYHGDRPRQRPRDERVVPLDGLAHRGELAELFSRARADRHRDASGYLWIDVVNPTVAELAMLADVFSLPKLQVEDALTTRQRPKIERSGNSLFVVMRAVNYIDATSDIESHQVSAFVGAGFLLTISQSDYDLADEMQDRLALDPQLNRNGAAAGFYAMLDVVVDGYVVAAAGIHDDIEQIEESVFSGERTQDAGVIYRLKRENLELRRAVAPLLTQADRLARGGDESVQAPLQPYFTDVADHLLRVAEGAEANDQLLMNLLMASTALLDLQQNEDMRRISAYVAMGVVPTLIAGIYGMNFEMMPELDEVWGYPFALGLMGLIISGLYVAFKRSGWL